MGEMKPNFYAIAGVAMLVGFLLAALTGAMTRNFRTVDLVAYTRSNKTDDIEYLFGHKAFKNSIGGEYEVAMSGWMHDNYLELQIKRENLTETRIIPLDHIQQLIFKEPK